MWDTQYNCEEAFTIPGEFQCFVEKKLPSYLSLILFYQERVMMVQIAPEWP